MIRKGFASKTKIIVDNENFLKSTSVSTSVNSDSATHLFKKTWIN